MVLSSFVVVFSPVFPTRFPGRMRPPRSKRGLVVEHVDDVEMRVVVAKVLAAAANAVLVAQHLLKLGAHLTTALARLQVYNLSRKSSLEVGSAREKRARRRENVRNSVW